MTEENQIKPADELGKLLYDLGCGDYQSCEVALKTRFPAISDDEIKDAVAAYKDIQI